MMEYTNLLNILLNYGSAGLLVMAALVFAVNIIVEVLKTVFGKLPTSLLTVAVSLAVTVLALLAASAAMDIAPVWYHALGAVVLGLFVAYAAMFGFDKFKDAWEKLRRYRSGG